MLAQPHSGWRFGSEQLFGVGTMRTEHKAAETTVRGAGVSANCSALRRGVFHESQINLRNWNWDVNLEWDARSLSLQGGEQADPP